MPESRRIHTHSAALAWQLTSAGLGEDRSLFSAVNGLAEGGSCAASVPAELRWDANTAHCPMLYMSDWRSLLFDSSAAATGFGPAGASPPALLSGERVVMIAGGLVGGHGGSLVVVCGVRASRLSFSGMRTRPCHTYARKAQTHTHTHTHKPDRHAPSLLSCCAVCQTCRHTMHRHNVGMNARSVSPVACSGLPCPSPGCMRSIVLFMHVPSLRCLCMDSCGHRFIQ